MDRYRVLSNYLVPVPFNKAQRADNAWFLAFIFFVDDAESALIPERDDQFGQCLIGNLDVYLNDRACWRNVPAAIWAYKLGGYQVLKKWLSYREHAVLGRVLTPEEVRYFAEMTRRVGAMLQVTARGVS